MIIDSNVGQLIDPPAGSYLPGRGALILSLGARETAPRGETKRAEQVVAGRQRAVAGRRETIDRLY